jgi:hypothetical protein
MKLKSDLSPFAPSPSYSLSIFSTRLPSINLTTNPQIARSLRYTLHSLSHTAQLTRDIATGHASKYSSFTQRLPSIFIASPSGSLPSNHYITTILFFLNFSMSPLSKDSGNSPYINGTSSKITPPALSHIKGLPQPDTKTTHRNTQAPITHPFRPLSGNFPSSWIPAQPYSSDSSSPPPPDTTPATNPSSSLPYTPIAS